MQLIRRRAYARAGLIGNPSDGYHGKTISIIVRNLTAEVVLYEWDQIEIMWSQDDHSRFGSVEELVQDVRSHGYYGGVRLVKATIKKFVGYCQQQGITLHGRNFSIRYSSNIPRQVGLAGSSAIIVATLRCLMGFYEVQIPNEVQPSLALSVETEELGIAAGLQDRVIQVYQGAVFMDFARERMRQLHGYSCGVYEPINPEKLPPLYLAYRAQSSEPTEVVHGNLRLRYEQGEPEVLAAIQHFASLTVQAREAILAGDALQLARLINENFDLRQSICQIADSQREMVHCARTTGASAKFAGSGGAIIGTYTDEIMFAALQHELGRIGCQVLRPTIVENSSITQPTTRDNRGCALPEHGAQ